MINPLKELVVNPDYRSNEVVVDGEGIDRILAKLQGDQSSVTKGSKFLGYSGNNPKSSTHIRIQVFSWK